jgi:hypothetical protein
MHEVITDPPAHIQNVTEWAKRAQCWEIAESVRVDELPGFGAWLVSGVEAKAGATAERRQQAQDSGIEAQIKVLGLGNDYWAGLRSWASGRGLLLQEDDAMLRSAAGLSGGVPSEWQAAKLLVLKARMEGEGFPER